MKLFNSVSFSALLSLLAYVPISSLAAPLTKRSDLKDNEDFGLLSVHSGNLYVHLHEFYVGESGNVYLDPYDHADTSTSFKLKDGHLVYKNEYAHIADEGALIFKSDSKGAAKGFSFGDHVSAGYHFVYNGKDPVACPLKEDSNVYSIFYGDGTGDSKCTGISVLAIPNQSSSSSSSTTTTSSAAKVETVATASSASSSSTLLPYTTKCVVVPATDNKDKKESNYSTQSESTESSIYPIFPNGIRLTNTSSADSNSGNVYSPVASQKENDHVNTIFTFDVPQVTDKGCQLHFHIDNHGFPINVNGPNGVGEFNLYNLSSVADDSTTWANHPNRIAEIGRFNCSSNGCDYTTNITCPSSYQAVSYELSAITDKSYLNYFEETNPVEGLYLTV